MSVRKMRKMERTSRRQTNAVYGKLNISEKYKKIDTFGAMNISYKRDPTYLCVMDDCKVSRHTGALLKGGCQVGLAAE